MGEATRRSRLGGEVSSRIGSSSARDNRSNIRLIVSRGAIKTAVNR